MKMTEIFKSFKEGVKKQNVLKRPTQEHPSV